MEAIGHIEFFTTTKKFCQGQSHHNILIAEYFLINTLLQYWQENPKSTPKKFPVENILVIIFSSCRVSSREVIIFITSISSSSTTCKMREKNSKFGP